VTFGDLALIVAAGLAGPLLAAGRRTFVPVVVGEILAGVFLGRTGLDLIHADNPTLSFLADAGFAMLMLTVGMNVPLRDGRLRHALGRGALAAGVAAIAAPLGGSPSGRARNSCTWRRSGWSGAASQARRSHCRCNL
jgi:Kef-type K+ transport system membrane component KefB